MAANASISESDTCCPSGSLPYLSPDGSSSYFGEKVSYIAAGGSPESPTLIYVAPSPASASASASATAPAPHDPQAGPGLPTATRGVIFASDIYGWNSGRTRACVDYMSTLGYVTVIPSLLSPPLEGGNDGDGLPPDFNSTERRADMLPFMQSFTWEAHVKPKLLDTIAYLHSKGVTRIAVVGFCWGGWVAARACADEDVSVHLVCGATAHPSMVVETRLGGDLQALVSSIKKPFLLQPAGNDPDDYRPGGLIYETLTANHPATKLVDFPTMKHGWCLRGDVTDPDVKDCVAKAFGDLNAYLCGLM